MRPGPPDKCPACKHKPHKKTCRAVVSWLSRLFGLDRGEGCGCTYWDHRWEAP